MTSFSRKGSLAGYVLVAAIATAVAGGGMAVDATTSTGTLKGCANKTNGSLRLASKCKKSEKRVSWSVRGPKGATGATGAAGAAGSTGPSDAWEKTSQTGVNATSTPVTLSVTVPAGSYDITGKAQEQNWDGTNPAALSCTLAAGSTILDQTFSTALANVVHGSITATADTTFTLSCVGSNSATNVHVNDPTLSAIKVGTIH